MDNVTGNENLEVVVHIHGGAFMIGAPKFMASPTFIMDKEVVYVSFNYRLAILGEKIPATLFNHLTIVDCVN